MALVLWFLSNKKSAAWRCTRSRADGGINVVKCEGMRGGCLWGILFSCCCKRRMWKKFDCGYRREDPGLKALFFVPIFRGLKAPAPSEKAKVTNFSSASIWGLKAPAPLRKSKSDKFSSVPVFGGLKALAPLR